MINDWSRKGFYVVFVLSMTIAIGCNRSKLAPNDKPNEPLNPKVSKKLNDYLISRLSMEQKIDLLGGTGFGTKYINKYEVAPVYMSDGPLGVRWGRSTAFPSAIAMASTWDTALVGKVGEGIGREVRGKARNIILGPNVNIARNPLNGRTFEAFGEDPVLTSAMGVSYIKGVQREGVAATVKHFVANNQEYYRRYVDSKVDERTLREIYFPAFKAAVQKAHVLAVMSAYNKLNGEYCSANNWLLNTVLKKEWGFDGVVMSDWGAVHSTFPTVNSGLDLEMPYGTYLNNQTLMPAVKDGRVTDSTINDKVRRILRVSHHLGILMHKTRPEIPLDSLINSDQTRRAATQTAREAIVLLKNSDQILPINTDQVKSIAVIGPNAAQARVVGGGSAETHPIYTVSPLQALKSRLKGKVSIQYAPGVLFDYMQPVDSAYFFQPDGQDQGLKTEYFNNKNFSGNPVVRTSGQLDFRQGSGEETPITEYEGFTDGFSVRWTGKILAPVTGEYEFAVRTRGRTEAYLEGQEIPTGGRNGNSYKVRLQGGKKYNLEVNYVGDGYNSGDGNGLRVQLEWKQPNNASIDNAVQAASQNDVAIIFAGTSDHYETEGRDRESLELPANQDELISRVAQANKNTIVVLTTGAPVLVDKWIDQVPGLLESWFDGDDIGNAITDVVVGKYNPSGKLPITFPKRWEDEAPSVQNYIKQDTVSDYSDGIFVGYRHFDKENIEPQFPFGYGLSYTSFAYKNLQIENQTTDGNPKVEVSFDIENTGKTAGAEVAQLYVQELNPRLPRPVKELKGFSRVSLEPGKSETVHITLNKNAFAYFDPVQERWVVDPAIFNVLVGSSSRNIQLQGSVELK